MRSGDAFRLKQEKEEVSKTMPSIALNDINDFKNIIKGAATVVSEKMRIRKSPKPLQEPFCKRRIESDIARFRKKRERRTKDKI